MFGILWTMSVGISVSILDSRLSTLNLPCLFITRFTWCDFNIHIHLLSFISHVLHFSTMSYTHKVLLRPMPVWKRIKFFVQYSDITLIIIKFHVIRMLNLFIKWILNTHRLTFSYVFWIKASLWHFSSLFSKLNSFCSISNSNIFRLISKIQTVCGKKRIQK